MPDVFIMHGKNGAEEYVYEEHQDDLLEYIRTARRIKLGEYTPPAIYGEGGSWSTYCDAIVEQEMDISLISGVGEKMRSSMMRTGFYTIQNIADTTSKELQKAEMVGKSKAPDFIASAKAIITDDYVRKEGKIDLPHKSVEMFLDLEGLADDATDTIHDYLIGVLVRQDGKEAYHEFVAENRDERQMLVDFLEFMKGFEDYVIYHWASYEHTNLKKMMKRHNVDGYYLLDKDVLIDLEKVAKKAFAFPVRGYSIKPVAKWMGYEWKQKDVGAMSSVLHYLDYVKDPVKNHGELEKVIIYNKDDCVATRMVKDWLVEYS